MHWEIPTDDLKRSANKNDYLKEQTRRVMPKGHAKGPAGLHLASR